MSDTPSTSPGPSRRDSNVQPPAVPYLSPRDTADLGPAGSLVQARDRERANRLAGRAPLLRDRKIHGSAALAVTGGVLLAVAIARQPVVAPLLVLAALGVLSLIPILLLERVRRGPVEADLAQQIDHERDAADQLDLLRSHGWSVLHDRLVPGTEHRIAHVLAGPAGIVIATVVPMAGPLRFVDGVLHTGDRSLQAWFNTRWWEATTVNDGARAGLADWPFTGPTFPLVLVPTPMTQGRVQRMLGQPPRPTTPQHPAVYNDVAVCSITQARHWVTSRPGPLGRLAAAQLAGVVESVCPPAGTRD